jgi:hypothetical protein
MLLNHLFKVKLAHCIDNKSYMSYNNKTYYTGAYYE